MDGHPVMARAGRSIAWVETFPGTGGYSVYVVQLAPAGYVILNSDDRLPPVVSFSAEATVDVTDVPQNALRALLLDYCGRQGEALAAWDPAATGRTAAGEPKADELHGPLLETSWNQNDPYNRYCPAVSGGLSGYDGRAPVGCVPTAYAQVLHFHRWPCHGEGAHSYTDRVGSVQGAHSADYADAYDWACMQISHAPGEPLANQEAVGELMKELGVAAEADYEADGTSASVLTLGNRLEDYLFFEPVAYQSSSAALIGPLEADLRAGFPCVVSIPGHAIVADGLMVDGGQTTYHINYGWGGKNNGWFTAGGIPGGSLQYGVTGLRPRLMAFPRTETVTGEAGGSVEVQWILPKRREGEVAQLDLMRHDEGTDTWECLAEDTVLASHRFSEVTTPWVEGGDFNVMEITSTSSYKDWVVSTTSGVADCFYKEPGGYANREYHLTSVDPIEPTASTRLRLRVKTHLCDDPFSIRVSANGVDFTELWSATGSRDWGDLAVDLSAYAGQSIFVRLEYTPGTYYVGGGVWVDSIGIQEVSGLEYEGQPVHYTLLTNLAAGTHTLAAVVRDGSLVAHARGPSFMLMVSESAGDADGDGLPDVWELQYYGGETNANPDAMAANGINTVREAYIAGLDPVDPSARFAVSLSNETGAVVQWESRPGRVYSVHGASDLSDGFHVLETGLAWPQSSWTDTVSQSRGFYQVGVQRVE